LYGLFLSRSFSRAAHLSFFVSFFVRSESPFLRPDPKPSRAGAVKANRLFGDHPQGLALTVPSTAAPSNAVGLGPQVDDLDSFCARRREETRVGTKKRAFRSNKEGDEGEKEK
jgi:hypothetical protein